MERGVTDADTTIGRNGFTDSNLRKLTVALAADSLDALGERHQVMAAAIRPIQPGFQLVGWARTVDVCATDVIPEEPYIGEMAAIAALRTGEVAVYQVEPAVEAALFGELFSLAAAAQGAVGAVLDGPVRDVRQLRQLVYPVFANGVCPYDTRGRAEVVAHDVPIVCGGVPVETGDLIVGDDDGVIVVPAHHVGAVLEDVVAKVSSESGARADLLRGAKVHEVWEKWHVF
jgi:4-hydroxy-4-methyl-2-oxoglutarate aldolase